MLLSAPYTGFSCVSIACIDLDLSLKQNTISIVSVGMRKKRNSKGTVTPAMMAVFAESLPWEVCTTTAEGDGEVGTCGAEVEEDEGIAVEGETQLLAVI